MCETIPVLVSLSKILLLQAVFSIYQTHLEKNVGPHSENKSQKTNYFAKMITRNIV